MKIAYEKLRHFYKTETVLCISGIAACTTMFFVPPSDHYIAYIDFRVLALLFCLMAVVAGFSETGAFLVLSGKLLQKVIGVRSLSLVLIMLCFFTSMWITNDVALITFVPLAIMVLSLARRSKYLIRVVVLQTVAANLGSMLTPVGNPQNLYLYSFFNIPVPEFLKITLPYTAVSFLLLCLTVLSIKKEPLDFKVFRQAKPERKSFYAYLLYGSLFLVCLACVLHILDYRIAFLVVLIFILVFDRKILKRIDYALLLTFVFFFVFVGNMGSIPQVKLFLAELLSGQELLISAAASQVISNVPAAVLLSAFTDNYKALILGTDIGGLGTLVASLASLISYKLYCRTENARPGKYLAVFTAYNALFLAGLCLFYRFASS